MIAMQKGKNSISIACKLELINLIKSLAGNEDQNEGFYLVKRLLTKDEEFKKLFIEKYGEAIYQETLKHYSKTNIEQRAERELKEQERKIKEDAKQKIEQAKVEFLKAEAERVEQKTELGKPEPELSPEELEREKARLEAIIKDFHADRLTRYSAENRLRQLLINKR
jgi:ABC-type transporter MlaC component